ncbi:MAG: GNAT family N-acetyltransferase [Candidatus Tumulicola sp.]
MTAALVAQVREAPAFRQLLELLVEYERSLPTQLRHGREPDVSVVRTAYGEPNAAFIASVGDVAAGCIAVTRLDGRTAIVQRLYVRPHYREHGLARALVTAAVDFCRKRGCARAVLDTQRDRLPAAYELYASIGFTICEPYGTVTYDKPTFMELRLVE